MFDQLRTLLAVSDWWSYAVRIGGFYILAWLVHRLAWRMAGSIVHLIRFTPHTRQPRLERQATVQSLMANAISFVAFAAATLISVGQFVQVSALIWMVGLFSAAFGLSARSLISDVVAGLSFIFEDTFAVGEKVEILEVEGFIEAINLRTTWI